MISDTNFENILEAWRDRKKSDNENNEIFDLLTQNRIDYLKKGKYQSLFVDQPFLIKNFHLIISYTVPIPKNSTDGYIPQEKIKDLTRKRSAIKGTLRSAKIFSDNLSPQFFINLMNGILNPNTQKHPQLTYDEHNTISNQMVDGDTSVLFDAGASTIIHKDKPFSVIPFHARQFPQHWPAYKNGDLIGSFYNKILCMPCQFIATLTVIIPDNISIKGMVKAKSARASQMADSPIAKFVPDWLEKKKDWDYTSEKIEAGNNLLRAFFQINLITPQGREQECEQKIQSIYGSLGWILSKSRYIPKHALLGSLPMGLCQEDHKALDQFGHYQSRLSWTCTNIAPWIGEWKGTQNPLMLFLGRRGQIVYFNHFDNTKGNYNISCAATSGAGKSFVTQEMVFCILGEKGRVFIIDAGHSYRNLCQLLDGTYIDFGDSNPILNPFSKIFDQKSITMVEQLQKKNPDYSIKDYMDDMMPMLKELLAQMASPEKPLDPTLDACLERALKSAVNEYRGETTITRVVEKCLEQKTEDGNRLGYADDLALMLHSYTKDGMYGRYFEGKNNIDLDNPLIVLELDALNNKGNLQPVVLLILMMQINQVMYLSGDKKQKKQVIIDEAWRLLGSGRAGSFIEEGYRVARKHGGSYMTITQKISDYFSSETAKAAYANSDFEWILRQKSGELTSGEKLGHIDNTDGKIDVLKALETVQGKYSEIAIISPDGLSVVRFIVDPATEKIYSTKAEEVAYLRKAQKEGKNIWEAVNDLLSQSEGR